MIICDHIGKAYGKRYALQDFSYTFVPGHIYAILGPNGSGKSTLMKMIAGLVKPSEGQIYMADHPLSWEDKRYVAYMPTEPYFFDYMTGIQVANYFQDFFDDFSMERFQWFMQVMQLNPEMKVRDFSTGMMAKFKVAINISRNASVMMLDEPLNGIDMIARDEVGAAIRQGFNPNTAVLISSHLIEDLEKVADYVLFIREGSLLMSGAAEEFRTKYGKSMSDMYREIFGNVLFYGQGMYSGGMQQPYGFDMQQGYMQQPYGDGMQQPYGFGMQQGYAGQPFPRQPAQAPVEENVNTEAQPEALDGARKGGEDSGKDNEV